MRLASMRRLRLHSERLEQWRLPACDELKVVRKPLLKEGLELLAARDAAPAHATDTTELAANAPRGGANAPLGGARQLEIRRINQDAR